MNQLKPMLLTSLKNYNRSQFVKDVTAGIIVAIIALPLSIALALASGVGPEAGIFTAIVPDLSSQPLVEAVFRLRDQQLLLQPLSQGSLPKMEWTD